MKTRSGSRKPVAIGGVLLVAASLVGAAIATTQPSGAARSAKTVVPEPGVKGCDVLLTAPAGHDCLLPWPNDAFTTAANTPTGRRLNISAKVDPTNVKGVHVKTSARERR